MYRVKDFFGTHDFGQRTEGALAVGRHFFCLRFFRFLDILVFTIVSEKCEDGLLDGGFMVDFRVN